MKTIEEILNQVTNVLMIKPVPVIEVDSVDNDDENLAAYDLEKKVVYLRKDLGEDLETALVHEMRHAYQDQLGLSKFEPRFDTGNPELNYRISWTEIDARTFTLWYIHGMKGKCPKVPFIEEIMDENDLDLYHALISRLSDYRNYANSFDPLTNLLKELLADE